MSPGCQNCYAERIARGMATRQHPAHGSMWREAYAHAFDLRLVPGRLEEPLKWKTPKMVFVNSMSDLFHPGVPDDYIEKVFAVMERADWHQYQILTKRPERMADWVAKFRKKGVRDNIWLGTSVELEMYLSRLEPLLRTDAKVKFVSFEPLLGRISGEALRVPMRGLSWAITGGESDLRAPRPADPEWFREIRDACFAGGVAYFHKQSGGSSKCECHKAWGCRLLDGRIYDGFPESTKSWRLAATAAPAPRAEAGVVTLEEFA